MADLHFLTAVQLSEKIKSKKISCLEMLDLFLARTEKFNPSLNAIIYLDKEAARERAKEADEALAKGVSWGALHGVPMTVKERVRTSSASDMVLMETHSSHAASPPVVALK